MDQHTLPELQQLLKDDLGKGADLLIAIAREGSLKKETLFRLITLKSMLAAVADESRKEDIRKELESLAADVLNNPPTDGATAANDEQAQAAQEKRKFFLDQGTNKRIVLEANDLCKSYGSNEFTLNKIDIVLRQGEITGLVGLNGNGKTTLLRILAGDILQDSGSLSYCIGDDSSESLDWSLIKRRMAYLPQELLRIPGTMERSLQIAAAVHGITGRQNQIETDYIIQRLGLAGYERKSWRQLAGGYKLRFSLARILIRKPRIIIMDEPLASLDIRARNALLYDLRELANSLDHPIAILLSSQHIDEIEAVSTKIYLLNKGEKIYYGPTFEIYKDRKENTYEVETSLSYDSLQTQLAGFNKNSIVDTGFAFLITTPLETPITALMDYLGDHKIPVRAIRDISNSCRKYLL